jgi:hypothetical protein
MCGAIPPRALMARCLGPGPLHIRLSTAFVQCQKPDAAVMVHLSGLSLLHLFFVSELRTCVFVCNKQTRTQSGTKITARPFCTAAGFVCEYSNLSLASL